MPPESAHQFAAAPRTATSTTVPRISPSSSSPPHSERRFFKPLGDRVTGRDINLLDSLQVPQAFLARRPRFLVREDALGEILRLDLKLKRHLAARVFMNVS